MPDWVSGMTTDVACGHVHDAACDVTCGVACGKYSITPSCCCFIHSY